MAGDGSYPTGYTLADMLVLSKVKAALGLDQLKYAVTGVCSGPFMSIHVHSCPFMSIPDSMRSRELNSSDQF